MAVLAKLPKPLVVTIILLLFSEILSSNSEKILSIQFISSKSHKNMYEPLLIELANRGHEVTVVNPYQSHRVKLIKNYREVTGVDYFKGSNTVNFFQLKLNSTVDLGNPFSFIPGTIQSRCPEFWELAEVQELLQEKFDLIIMESFMNECIYGMIPHFNTSFIFINTFATPFWLTGAVGLPTFPSITPLPFLEYSEDMSFFQRVRNFYHQAAGQLFIDYKYKPNMEAIYRKYVGENTPGVDEISRNVSLILENSNPSINAPRPTLPEIVEVGGMHCVPAKSLRKVRKDK